MIFMRYVLLWIVCCVLPLTTVQANDSGTDIYKRFVMLYRLDAFQNYRASFVYTTQDPTDHNEKIVYYYDVHVNGENYIVTRGIKQKASDGLGDNYKDMYSWDGKLAIKGASDGDENSMPGAYTLNNQTNDENKKRVNTLLQCLQITTREPFFNVTTATGQKVCTLGPIGMNGNVLTLAEFGKRDHYVEEITFQDTSSLMFSQIERYLGSRKIDKSIYKDWKDFSGRKLPTHITIFEGDSETPYRTLTLVDFQSNPDTPAEDYRLTIPNQKGVFIQNNLVSPPQTVMVESLTPTLMREKNYEQAVSQAFANTTVGFDRLEKQVLDIDTQKLAPTSEKEKAPAIKITPTPVPPSKIPEKTESSFSRLGVVAGIIVVTSLIIVFWRRRK